MRTTREDILRWLEEAKAQGATHMIVVCDTFDWSDYPVFVKPGADPRAVWDQNNGPNMTKAMECYRLASPWETQLGEHRARHFEP